MSDFWIVTAISCDDCNTSAVGYYNHEPTEEDLRAVKKECGGMYCINTNTTAVAIAAINTPIAFPTRKY